MTIRSSSCIVINSTEVFSLILYLPYLIITKIRLIVKLSIYLRSFSHLCTFSLNENYIEHHLYGFIYVFILSYLDIKVQAAFKAITFPPF